MKQFDVKFEPSGRGKARCAPNPAYPNGIAITIPHDGEFSCKANLPYPAPECGHFLVTCLVCKLSVAVTAAGRPDDPISIALPCKDASS